jgi:hypothetical protein
VAAGVRSTRSRARRARSIAAGMGSIISVMTGPSPPSVLTRLAQDFCS